MAIGLICINCGAQIKVPESAAGKRGKCPKCSEVIRIFETASMSTHLCDQCGKSLAREKNIHKVSGKLYCDTCFIKIRRGKVKKGTEIVKPIDLEVGKGRTKTTSVKKPAKLGKGQRAADKFLIRLLEEQGVLKESDIEPLLDYQKALGKRLIPLVRDINLISEKEIAKTISEISGLEQVPAGELDISDNVLEIMDEETMKRFDAVPLSMEGELVYMVMPNPLDISAVQELRQKLQKRAVPRVCTWSQYTNARKLFREKKQSKP